MIACYETCINQSPSPLPYQNSNDKGENNLIVTSQELSTTDS